MLFIGDICCGSALPIGIQLIDKNNNLIDVGAFNSTTLGTPGQTFGLPGPTNGGTFDILKNGFEPVPGNGFIYTFTNPLPNLELKGIALYGFAGYYAVDNIVVTAVPEPSAYAMFAVGLGVLGFAARRRQQKANQAAAAQAA
ncbi:MAG: PEP-CTERM sorting domain-containing protein [Rubrivivax sp.]|nr:PEP-CTERM sorting domain-containing protein [Rubrivivax sp.]